MSKKAIRSKGWPHIEKIPYKNPHEIFSCVSHKPWSVILDSASLDKHCGRYSFIAVDPFLTLKSKNNYIELNEQTFIGDPFSVLKEKLQEFSLQIIPDYPPFQGGAVGYFSYDLCHHLEKLPRNKDDMEFPDMMLGFYDLVIGIDHHAKEAYIFSSGFPAHDIDDRSLRAQKRLKWLKQILNTPINFVTNKRNITELIFSNFDPSTYKKSVQHVIDYIHAGDIFQANISQRFSCTLPNDLHPWQLYQRLRHYNPAPFAAYLNYDDIVIASASPERFLKLSNGKVETRPIKGTRQRSQTPEADKRLAKELLESEKDRSENVMIVDLLRNDLSRVCKSHTVKVEKLCGLESYVNVHHLVSIITCELEEKYDAVDLLKATFPGGSVTGAPKVRAMEIIAKIEPTQRGPYCGSIGYIGFDGNMDTSIVIRTLAIKNNQVTFQAGGGIVADSNPTHEYEETLIKARALHRTLTEVES